VTPRARVVAGALAVVIGGGLLVTALFAALRSDDDASPVAGELQQLFVDASAAGAPFTALTEAQVAVGGRCLRVAVADTEAERSRGLMDRRDLGPYDGMVFVSPTEVANAFTMSGTFVPLDIAWFRTDGTRADDAQMVPCRGTVAECPRYDPKARWRFALETLHGDLPSGDLAPCA
jgi:uncharacterized membrane protein (UPF0127 family)